MTYTITHLSDGGPDAFSARLTDTDGNTFHGITLWKDNWGGLEEGKKIDGEINHLTLRPIRSKGIAY